MSAPILRSNPPGLWPTSAANHVNEDTGSGLIFLTGQVGVDEQGAVVSPSLGEQLHQIFLHFDTILNSLDLDRTAFLRVQILTTSREEFYAEGIASYRAYFDGQCPAGTLSVVGLASPDYKVELEAVLRR